MQDHRTDPGGIRVLPDQGRLAGGHDDRFCHLLDDAGNPLCGFPLSRLSGRTHTVIGDSAANPCSCGLPR
jgi:hypothetical protein